MLQRDIASAQEVIDQYHLLPFQEESVWSQLRAYEYQTRDPHWAYHQAHRLAGLAEKSGNPHRFEEQRLHLTENYFAPVPSQFMKMPRAMSRTDDDVYSVGGYTRALAEDCIYITGGGMDAPL